jgi:ketosteroid isomerase-like protein
MHDNLKLLVKFYTGFAALKADEMNSCYDERAEFSDPIFGDLDYEKTTAMWSMLTSSAENFELKFTNVKADDDTGSVEWIATYTFSKTGHKVTNRVRSQFYFHHGRIIRQFDYFDLLQWSRQALGPTGWLFGWCTFFKRGITKGALEKLSAYQIKARLKR